MLAVNAYVRISATHSVTHGVWCCATARHAVIVVVRMYVKLLIVLFMNQKG